MHDPSPPSATPDPTRLDRRTLLRKAAAAGAAAWVAPTVIQSIASPAAAATGDPGAGGASVASACYRAEFVRSGTTYVRQNPAQNGSGCLDPSIWNNRLDFPGTITVTGAGPFTFTLSGVQNAQYYVVPGLQSVARVDQANDCANPVAYGAGNTSVTFNGTILGNKGVFNPVDRYKLLISVGGTACV